MFAGSHHVDVDVDDDAEVDWGLDERSRVLG